jgi:Helix-turn-helix domain
MNGKAARNDCGLGMALPRPAPGTGDCLPCAGDEGGLMTGDGAPEERLFLSLGRQLREARQQAGRTQAQVVRSMCYSRQAVSAAECGVPRTSHAFWESADAVLATGGTLTVMYDQARRAMRRARSALPGAEDDCEAYGAACGMRVIADMLERMALSMNATADLLSRIDTATTRQSGAARDDNPRANGRHRPVRPERRPDL